jgi:hypothetical protein
MQGCALLPSQPIAFQQPPPLELIAAAAATPDRFPMPNAAPGTGAMARNFAVVYLEQAVARALPAERFAEANLPGRAPA